MKRNILLIWLLVYIFVGLGLPFITLADISLGSTTSLVVPPRSDNYQLAVSDNVGQGPISQGSDITYTITYGASSSAVFASTGILTVDFSQDTFDGVTHVADYIYNSATNGYGGAIPIVDLVNRKITWNLPQMPAGTIDQIVSFKMKTNSNYTDSNQIPMIISSNFSNQYMTLQKSLTVTYGFHISPPGPPATPTPIVSPTPTQPTNPSLSFELIQFTQVSPNDITIHITTSQKTRLRAFYGVLPNTLNQLTSDTNLSSSHDIQITKLQPQTKYYLKVTATTENGGSISSDIMTFTTATTTSQVHIDQNSIVFVSGNYPLVSTNTSLPFIQVLIPNNQIYSLALKTSSPQNIKSIVALVENAHVLGVNTFGIPYIDKWSTPMQQEQPGIYIAQLTAPSTPSVYDVFAKISDIHGNISQTKIAEAIVYGPMKIIDASTKKGIEHARIFLSRYNNTKKTYEPIFSSYIQNNPLFTDKDGLAVITSGAGKYRISVSQYDYRTEEVSFTIDKTHLLPPTVSLQHIGFTVGGFVQYYSNTISDFAGQLVAGLEDISSATRFFKLISILVLLSLIFVTFLLFLIRTKLSLIVIPLFIKHHTTKAGIIHGQILDAITHQPVALGVIAISNKLSHEILATVVSSNKGIFYLKPEWVSSENNMNILANGYRTNKFAINEDLFPAVIYLHHNLVGGPLHNPIIASLISFAAVFFETLLVVSLILEIFFIPTIGLLSVPFVTLSLFNVFLWILYSRERILF